MKTYTSQTPKLTQGTRLIIGGGFLLLALLMGILGSWLLGSYRGSDIVYIQTTAVFESFTLTQELDAKLNQTFEARKTILDNLDLQMQTLTVSQDVQRDSLLFLRRNFEQKQQEFSEDHSQQRKVYHERILTQINQYVQDFRKANGYDIVLGADGSGNIMAADPDQDVTEAFIQYLNQTYEGK